MAAEDQCTACGERNPVGSAFCVFCGTYLGWDEPGRGPAAPSGTPRPVPPQSAPTPPPAPAPTTLPAPVPPPIPLAATGAACPRCGQDNPTTRRFCGRCGQPLVAATATAAAPIRPVAAPRHGWWDQEARTARRQYRRSLPPLYRWRRVLVALALVAGTGLVLTLTGNNPVGFVQDRWRDLTVDPEPLEGVAAAASPEGSVASTYDVRRLPGPRQEAWATAWPAGTEASPDCGVSQAAGKVVLTWDDATRVRGLDVWAGLGSTNKDRGYQFLPKRLDVVYDGGCVRLDLEETPDRQRLSFDTETEVSSLLVSVGDVYPNSANPAIELVAIGGIEVLHQPD